MCGIFGLGCWALACACGATCTCKRKFVAYYDILRGGVGPVFRHWCRLAHGRFSRRRVLVLPALRWRRRLVVFGWVELDEKLFRSRCAVLTVFVVTFEFGRVSRGRIAFERSSAVDGVGRMVLVASLGGNPESLQGARKSFTYLGTCSNTR